MAAPDDGEDARAGGFLGRWSRRKAQAREGQPLPEPAPAAPVAVAAPAPPLVPVSESDRPLASTDIAPSAIKNEVPALTLDDVQALALEGDFKPFVARGVAPEVRNAAFRKLFSDPHYNVMDGLDIYIDDYGQPDPLPAAMLKQLASARFLKLVEDEPEAQGSAPPLQNQELPAQHPPELAADAAPDAAADESPPAAPGDSAVAPSPLCNDLPTTAVPAGVAPRPDADPDLRLQPDDAARRAAHRPGSA